MMPGYANCLCVVFVLVNGMNLCFSFRNILHGIRYKLGLKQFAIFIAFGLGQSAAVAGFATALTYQSMAMYSVAVYIQSGGLALMVIGIGLWYGVRMWASIRHVLQNLYDRCRL